MKMYITMCGCQQKFTKKGEEYGMPATVFCSTENFFGSGVFEEAARLSRDEAVEAIMQQVLMLNPNAEEKKIAKFIFG
ncbi:MAG: hypothetical protein FWC78_06135 [Defluviitaleaceae bacterium]|nr:hypothetical protein [Defluviitaleaceae bacterium]